MMNILLGVGMLLLLLLRWMMLSGRKGYVSRSILINLNLFLEFYHLYKQFRLN